jgi:tRNA U34 5-methylaminomethyl-2-thiouridine-forming methyltransferase MnmC
MVSAAQVDWRDDGTPVSRRHDDPYFSRHDGRGEVRHVFLAGNHLPQRWAGRTAFAIAELGFGTGLSFLETLATWRRSTAPGARLTYLSFEIDPLGPSDIGRAVAPWPELAPLAGELAAIYAAEPGWNRMVLEGAELVLAVGDANVLIGDLPVDADAWFLDGFDPRKNPELWGAELMRAVFEATAPGGTLATYSAASRVKANLAAAGFAVRKRPGHAFKREMLAGVKPG